MPDASSLARSIILGDRSTPTARSPIAAARRTAAPLPQPTSRNRSLAPSSRASSAESCMTTIRLDRRSSSYVGAHLSNPRLAASSVRSASCRPSLIAAVVDLAGHGVTDLLELRPTIAQLLQVLRVRAEPVHPLVEPGVEGRRFPGDAVPLQ